MRLTNEHILKKFLLKRIHEGNTTISSHNIEIDLVRYAKEYWGRIANPSTFSRAWRKLKENGKVMDYNITPIVKESEGTWHLTKSISNSQHHQLVPEVE